jgi:hypothetical protein
MEAYFGGDVYATDFITLSRVADMRDNKKALDKLDNITEWETLDSKGKKRLNYNKHYAGGYKERSVIVGYKTKEIKTKQLVSDENGKLFEQEIITEQKTPIREKRTIGYLSMETRVAEMEKMIYELKEMVEELKK